MINKIFIIFIIIFGVIGCIKIEKPSEIPEITYLNHTSGFCQDQLGNQNKCVTLHFQLKDGDGNIGLSETDTIPPFTDIYSHNFYYNVLIPSGDSYIPWNALTINYFNIPYIETEGQNKVLIADVKIDMSFPVNTLANDTIAISFYIYDRALNQSNVEYTDLIIFDPENE